MSDIKGNTIELREINLELSRMNKDMKKLKTRKAELEQSILEYITNNDVPGVKYNDIIIISEEGKARMRKNAKEKEEESIGVLREYGVSRAEEAYKRILNAMKGDTYTKQKLKIKEIKS